MALLLLLLCQPNRIRFENGDWPWWNGTLARSVSPLLHSLRIAITITPVLIILRFR